MLSALTQVARDSAGKTLIAIILCGKKTIQYYSLYLFDCKIHEWSKITVLNGI